MRTPPIRALVAVLAIAALTLGAPGAAFAAKGGNTPPAGDGPGNKPNAKMCQKGGWETLATSENEPFTSEEECTAYAARGGVLQLYVEPPTNTAPVAVDDSFTLSGGTMVFTFTAGGNVLENDWDDDEDPLTATLVSGPSNGLVDLNPDGSFTYLGNGLSDSFTYVANDGTTDSNLATVTLVGSQVNTAPVAVNDSYALKYDGLIWYAVGDVSTNDTDAEHDTLHATLVSGPTSGEVRLNDDGTFVYSGAAHVPCGVTDSFTYTASDGTATSTIATVTFYRACS